MGENVTQGSDRVRRLVVTPGNVRQHHLYVSQHLDFFPPDIVGPPNTSPARSDLKPVRIKLDGLNRTVETDIGREARSGKPRRMFRRRDWVRDFLEHHRVRAGDALELHREGPRDYTLKPSSPERPRAAEFFAGIGLVRVALERQGWDVAFSNDIDPNKARMYRHNWPSDDALVVGDIHTLDPASIPTCSLFTASFPCNDLSVAGRREGLAGKESSAFWGLIRILSQLGDRRPRFVFLENVLGFLTSHGGRDFESAVQALNELGYAADAFVLNAIHWVPQSRARLFVVGERDRSDGDSVTLATDARPAPLAGFINAHQHLNWRIHDLPPLPKPTARLTDVVEDLPPDDQHWWSDERAAYFMSQLSEKHAATAAKMIAGSDYSYGTAFRRVRRGRSMAELRTDGIAGCLRTPRGGSGRQILFKAGRGSYGVRLLTARECARLQGVPDDYVINVPLNQALFGFGDAVCVPAIEWICEYVLARHPAQAPESRR